MVAGFLILLKAFLNTIREEEQEEKKELPTMRQSLIKIIALIVTAFIGFIFLGVMDYVIQNMHI